MIREHTRQLWHPWLSSLSGGTVQLTGGVAFRVFLEALPGDPATDHCAMVVVVVPRDPAGQNGIRIFKKSYFLLMSVLFTLFLFNFFSFFFFPLFPFLFFILFPFSFEFLFFSHFSKCFFLLFLGMANNHNPRRQGQLQPREP